ncbi:hypothetical protein GPECTOR_16g741 [Gonium pectorale]|uniref:Uncharacterized protein n=1 Tax=Gonium pectorale TaxID=33097 RepID=A0A150GL33_GONPE|nr:hypothetical protein GPECTOR_16g741 [Gonium pectorale]|eukprot:KXZ50566.1 hypothetical protein GPECTOR_16g741 [Gonium pectorale]
MATATTTAAPAPLYWPLPPALRHLSLDLAEMAALAALQPPASLDVVSIGGGGAFFLPDERHNAAQNEVLEDDVEETECCYKVPAGCGTAMRGTAALLSGRMQERALTVCLLDSEWYWCLKGDAAPVGHAAWISELRPMGLRSLCLAQLALEAGDMVQLAAAVPDLEELALKICQLPPNALPVLRHLPRLRRLEILGWDAYWPADLSEDALQCQLLGLCAGEAGAPDLSLRFGADGEEFQEYLHFAIGWVQQQLPPLRCHRRVEAEVVQFPLL